MKVAVYHRSVPNAKNQEKVDLLRFFGQGVRVTGDSVTDVSGYEYLPDHDVSVIQGWINDSSERLRPHLELRNNVVSQCRQRRQHVIAVDSNLFLYADTENPMHYLRYSFDGIFPNTGNYCDSVIDPARWIKVSQNLNIKLRPYRDKGSHILLCLQRNGGWSMGKLPVLEWAADIIIELRKYTDRPIVIRPHPGDKAATAYIGTFQQRGLLKDVRVSEPGTPLVRDLKNCWAAINYNSSPVVGAAIEGIPIFVTDVSRSQCREIANTDLSTIENPLMPDRLPWVQRLSMFHWNFNELKSGECWYHMRSFVS